MVVPVADLSFNELNSIHGAFESYALWSKGRIRRVLAPTSREGTCRIIRRLAFLDLTAAMSAACIYGSKPGLRSGPP